jgi:CRP-like cAMP-binding protein
LVVSAQFEATLNVGAFFGELALRNADKRAATVTAVGALTCLSMDRNAFTRVHIPPHDSPIVGCTLIA